MKTQIRRATREDLPVLSDVCYRAFRSIAEAHNFRPDFDSIESANGVLSSMISNPGFYGIVAEADGRVAGSNFMDERAPIAGIGPISVDPDVQNDGAGRAMMEHMVERVGAKGMPGVRLVQTCYHNRSFSLYSKLGFEVREQLATMEGPPLKETIAGYPVRRATDADVDACNRLCFQAHGIDRGGELRDAIKGGSANVVERLGRITGYSTAIGFGGYVVGESNEELKALIAAATFFYGNGPLIPTRNGEMVRWCYSKGLRLTQLMTLMSVGLYSEPRMPFIPSILF